MEFLILGPLECRDGGHGVALGGPQQRAVLAMLLLAKGEAVSRDALTAGIWGERPPKSAGHIVESYISRLRRAIDAADLVTRPHGYALKVTPGALDAERFETLAARGRALLAADQPEPAAGAFEAALALFRGPPLDDLAFLPFARAEAARLEELRLATLQDRIEAQLAAGRDRELIPELSVLAARHPFIERLHGQLMLALYRAGRQADALAAYRALRTRLVDELGIEPSPSLRALEAAILRQEPLAGPPGLERPPARVGRRRRRPRPGVALAALVGAIAVVAVAAVAAAVMGGGGGGSPTEPRLRDAAVVTLDPLGRMTRRMVVPDGGGDALHAAGAVWLAQFEDNTIVRVDPRGMGVRQTIVVGSGPSGMAFGAGSVWVANSLDGTVSRVDPRTDRVVDTIAVGGAPAALAYDRASLWVANGNANEVARVDAATGRVTARFPLPSPPTDVAAAHGAVWVSSERDGVVLRIAPRSGDVASTRVGTGPTDIETAAGAVWVANTLDGTVSRLDAQTAAVRTTLPVGDGPVAVEAAFGSVWVASEFDGTVTRIDPRRGEVAQSVRVGGRPQALAVGGDAIWVGLRAPGAGHRGGTLRVGFARPALDSIDPAIAYLLSAAQLMGITNDGLVTLKHVGGRAGTQLVPDLAIALPIATNGGRRYRFELRPGIRYSNGRAVAARDLRRAIERAFRLRSPGASLYSGIVGGVRCLRRPRDCDLSAGIVPNEAARVVTFNLAAPDPDFLYKLTLPFAAAIPAGIPDRDIGRRPVPATGPYMIERYVPGRELRMVRNPFFREWSRAAQPDGFVDRIEYRLGAEPERIVTGIERGDLDWGVYFTPFAPPRERLHEILTRYRDQVHTNPLPQLSYLIMNTREPPFDDVRVRRALNFAIDRNVLVDLYGGPGQARPTCQVIPPGIPGYRPYCPYTASPASTGAYNGPDLARARRLVADSGTRGMRVRLLTDPEIVESGYIVSVLRGLGYRATSRSVADAARYNALASNSVHRVQISVGGVFSDYPAASNIIDTWLGCRNYRPRSDANNNRAAFCEPVTEAGIRGALRLGAADPAAAGAQWARVDRAIVDRAPWLPTVNANTIDFVSRRVGNYQFHPQWGLLLDQLWIR